MNDSLACPVVDGAQGNAQTLGCFSSPEDSVVCLLLSRIGFAVISKSGKELRPLLRRDRDVRGEDGFDRCQSRLMHADAPGSLLC